MRKLLTLLMLCGTMGCTPLSAILVAEDTTYFDDGSVCIPAETYWFNNSLA